MFWLFKPILSLMTVSQVVIHELGHVVACLILRIEVRGVAFSFLPVGKSWTVFGCEISHTSKYSGVVWHEHLRNLWQVVIVVFAGPLANIVVATCLISVYIKVGLLGSYSLQEMVLAISCVPYSIIHCVAIWRNLFGDPDKFTDGSLLRLALRAESIEQYEHDFALLLLKNND